jgi:hypothetical protein
MSYDILLCRPAFLKRALEENLGDWTDAEPISERSLLLIREWLLDKGYIVEHEREGCRELVHLNSKWGLQVSLFKAEVAFTIPYWDEADIAIDVARSDAKELAKFAGLGYYDPQTGDVALE